MHLNTALASFAERMNREVTHELQCRDNRLDEIAHELQLRDARHVAFEQEVRTDRASNHDLLLRILERLPTMAVDNEEEQRKRLKPCA